MIIIGYSGHSFVVCEVLISSNIPAIGYCDREEKTDNPYQLRYLGKEDSEEAQKAFSVSSYFVSIGDNQVRGKVTGNLKASTGKEPVQAIHSSTWISPKSRLSAGVLVSANAAINSMSVLGEGVIANTGCIIEHECTVGDFVHICPGAVLAGNVSVGAYSFIGANSVVKQGVKIGRNVIVGAGSVVLSDVPDNVCVVGNPAKIIKNL